MNWALWRRWTAATTAGELAGFAAPALAGAWLAGASAEPGQGYAVMLAAGVVEGFCLGWAQAWALRRHLPSLPRLTFAAATSVAACLAYAIAMIPSTSGDRLGDWPVPLLAVITTVGGVVVLASIGGAQWFVLRHIGIGHTWWIAATAGAWLAGLAVFLLVATPLWHEGQPLWLTVAIGLFGGALMAFTVAALTGFAAVRLTRRAPERSTAYAG